MRGALLILLATLIALTGPLAAYSIYPSKPVLSTVESGFPEAAPPRHFPEMLRSMRHAVSFRGTIELSGHPRPLEVMHGVFLEGRRVIPAPGPWLINQDGRSVMVPHLEVARLMGEASFMEARGVKAVIYVRGRGVVNIVIATRMRLATDKGVLELQWLGSRTMHRHWG